MSDKTPIQYKDLTPFSDKIGAVDVKGYPLQLCDYVECIGGLWFAAAYVETKNSFNDNAYQSMGVIFKKNRGKKEEPIRLAYIPESLLDKARPRFDDEHETEALIKRLKKELDRLNKRLKKA